MRRYLALIIILLATGAGVAVAQEPSSPKSTLSLTDVRSGLLGQDGKSGVLTATGPIDTEFEGVVLRSQDVPQLISLLQETIKLSPRAEVIIRGTIDGEPFKTKTERTKAGNLEFKLEGVKFADLQQVLTFLNFLVVNGAKEVKLETLIKDKPIELKFEEGTPKVKVVETGETFPK
jgi:hypothetical protein